MKGFDLVQGLDITETQLRDRWGWKKWQWMLIWANVNIFIFKSKIWDVKKKKLCQECNTGGLNTVYIQR